MTTLQSNQPKHKTPKPFRASKIARSLIAGGSKR